MMAVGIRKDDGDLVVFFPSHDPDIVFVVGKPKNGYNCASERAVPEGAGNTPGVAPRTCEGGSVMRPQSSTSPALELKICKRCRRSSPHDQFRALRRATGGIRTRSRRCLACEAEVAASREDNAPREGEEWRAIADFEGRYEVSSLGRVRRLAPLAGNEDGIILRGVPNVDGYPRVDLRKNGRGGFKAVHILVALAFLGPCPEGHEVNHKNHDRADCRLSNLEYMTPSQNIRHALLRAGHGRVRATPEIVRTVRRSNEPVKVLAARYGLGLETVRAIRAGISWRFLPDEKEDV